MNVDNNFYKKKKEKKAHLHRRYVSDYEYGLSIYILLKEFEYIGGEWINIARLSISQR